MRHIVSIIFAGFFAAFLVQCDFPSDPPLRPVASRSTTLLPFNSEYQCRYLLYPHFSDVGQDVNEHLSTVTAPDGEYKKLLYYWDDNTGEGTIRKLLLQPLMRVKHDGVEFFGVPVSMIELSELDITPTLYWKFPYPANAGTTWQNPDGKWETLLSATDTLVIADRGSFGYSCYAYEVFYTPNTETKIHILSAYVLPGQAIFKINHRYHSVVATTLAWIIGD
jgi:hypothetical protein